LETNELKSALNIDALLACSAARLSLPATEKAGILNNRAVLLCRRRKYLEAESVLREALTLWGGEPGAVAALNSLCLVCVRTGRTIEALNYAEAAVRAGERTLARSHPMLVRPLANLASLHQMAGQDGEAELAFRRALAIAESVSGPDHPLVVSVLRERALSLRKAGRPALAQPLEKRAETLDANWRRAGKAEYTVDVSEYGIDLGAPHQR
jgi:tetratricopeptide (TPR) repeat protein